MRPDGVIFDVDGVLVDVRGSYYAAIARAVQWVFTRDVARLRDDAPLVDADLIAAYKREGGWNNDWDLAYGLVLRYAAALRPGHRSTTELRAIADAAAGARRSLRVLEAEAAGTPHPSFEDVKGLMLELHWGSDEAAARFGVRPRLANREPLLAQEAILLRPETVARLRELGVRGFAVITGRLRFEWESVRDRLPLPFDAPVLTDEDGRKPDPSLLARLVKALDARRPCYVGDAMDDLAFVVAYNASALGHERPALAVIVCDEAREPEFRGFGASLFVRDVNELPDALASL